MAIKERKQITGTEAQIKGYAGHNGVLAYATDTKHLHVLSGTAGTTTELANRADIPNVSGKADTTYVNAELAKKQAKGDYATNTALTSGLAGKANSSHTHAIDNVTGLQNALNAASTQASNAIPKAGNRGAIAGYEQWTRVGATTTLNASSGDALWMETGGAAATITLHTGSADSIGQVATKLVWVAYSNKSITINGDVRWWAKDVPTINKNNAVLLFFFHDGYAECQLIGQWD